MGIGQKIKQFREAADLTQEELAELIGVTASAVGNYEREVSHPREDVLYKLFDALNVEPNELFSDCYKPVNEKPQQEKKVSLNEHIEKYLALDCHGKTLVDACTQIEYERCVGTKESAYNIGDSQDVLAAARDGASERIKLKKRKGAGSILDKPTYKGGAL